MSRYEETVLCYDKVLELDPRDFKAWASKSISLYIMGRKEEAMLCYDKTLKLAPPCTCLLADRLSQWQEAAHSYQRLLTLALAQQHSEQIEDALHRLQELGV